MKTLFALLVLSLSVNAFARLSDEAQLSIVEKIAKAHRRQMHIRSISDVQSSVEKVSKPRLDELMELNPEAESPLERGAVGSLYRCLRTPKSCTLFLISLSGEMYGDAGETHDYVLLDPNTGKYEEIMHEVYSE